MLSFAAPSYEAMNAGISKYYAFKNDATKTNVLACSMIAFYLEQIGTPTAFRLISDLKKLMQGQPIKQI